MRERGREPIRVAHLITGLDTGGAEMMLYKLLAGMDRRRFDARVISMTGRGSLGGRIESLGVPLHDLGMKPGRPDPLGLMRLVRLLRRERVNILQTWLYHADLLGLTAGRLVAVPAILWNLRCSEMPEQAAGTRQLYWVLRLLARLSRLPAAVVVNSSAGQALHERLGYRPRRWALIPNGFDLEAFRPDADAVRRLRERLGIPADAPVVGLVARFHAMKDHQTFLAAAARLRRTRPDVHFVAVGEGVEPSNPALAGMLREAGLADGVHLLGRRADVAGLTPGFSIATLSSAYGEGFPNVIGEAMASGVPCVVTDVGDSAAVVGDTGIVVPPRSAEALAEGWRCLLDLSPVERARMGEAARRRIAGRFSLGSVVREYEALYQEIARPGSAGAAAGQPGSVRI